MKVSERLERIPPYLFAQLERKIAEKRAQGVDVISLGIGDPDTPTPRLAIDALADAASDPATHQYPSNRGRREFRDAFAAFYARRFGVTLDPESEIIPALGAKECIFNLNLAFLDSGSVALAADPGYPVYTAGPLLAGAEAVAMPLAPSLGFVPDLDAVSAGDRERARLMFINYPNNPTGATVPDGFFERVVEFAREHEVLVVHDASYTETTFDGYVAPSFLETPGAREVGVEVFSLSKGYNMTGWRTAAIVGNREAVETYWRLKTNIDSGMFEAVQLAAAAALELGDAAARDMRSLYARRRDLVCDALREIGVDVTPPKGTIYVWAPVPAGYTSASYCEHVLEESAVVLSPGGCLRRRGRGLLQDLADRRRRAPARGGRAAPLEPRGLMRYCGILVAGEYQHLCMLEEVRLAEPPIRLRATFFEPGSVEDVAAAVRGEGEVVVAVAAPAGRPDGGRGSRVCDTELRRRGVFPLEYDESGQRLFQALRGLGSFEPQAAPEAIEGPVDEDAYRDGPVFETHPDGVFCALHGLRVPAKRHPFGIQLRIEELEDEQVEDEGGDLWYRRIEELEAAAAALCAHRYAVGHACWVGDPGEGVIVLPGTHLPREFSGQGVIPPVPRVPLRRR